MTKTPVASRMLVVLPDDDARTFMRRRLAVLGYEVVEAADGAKALSLIDADRFDLALLDLQTGDRDGEGGLDLLRQMRERRSAADLPILAIAREGGSEDVVEALALGADDCLQRPLHIDVAHARSEMLIRRRDGQPATRSAKGELLGRLAALEEAAVRTEAVSANLEELGHDVTSPINGLLGAASVLTAVCQTADLKPVIARIETAAAALDMVMVRALGRADRRNRAPKAKIRVLLADDDIDTRSAVRDLLHASEIEVELVEASGGLEAALLTDTSFFDLIVLNLAAPRAIAGIHAIRRTERKTKTRRTPVLAFGTEADRADKTYEAGADLFMRQPINAERLLSALAEALARQSEDVSAAV